MKAFNPRFRSFALWVLLPAALCAIYLLFLAARRYEAEAMFYVRAINGEEAGPSFLAGFLADAGGDSPQDAAVVGRFVRSTDLAAALDRELDLRSQWQDSAIDPLHRLGADDSFDDLHEMYLKQVEVTPLESNILRVRARGFKPEQAQALLAGIIRQSESFINGVSRQLAEKQVGFVEQQVAELEERLKDVRLRRREFENRQRSLNLSSDAQLIYANIGTLEGERSRKAAELSRVRSFLAADAPQVRSLESEVEGLTRQIVEERGRLAGSDESLNALMAENDRLTLEEEFARNAFTSAYQTLEATRLEALQNFKSLVVIQSPRTPDDPRYPRVGYWLTTITLVLALCYLIGSLSISVINEHR